jgi:hypothetical protein
MSPTPFLYLVTSLRHFLIVSKPPLKKHESPVTSHQSLNSFFSSSCGLTYTTANTQSLSFQSLPHAFHRDGGCTPLASQFSSHRFRCIGVDASSSSASANSVLPANSVLIPAVLFQFPISCFQFPALRNSLKVRGVDFHRRRSRNQVQRQHHATGVLLPDKLSFHPRQRPALDAYASSNTYIRMRFDP